MKRFLIFALLGPPLGFITFFWGLLGLMDAALGEPSNIDPNQIVLLPLAYFLGIGPALVAAAFDHAMAKRGLRWRVLWTALFSYAVGFLPIFTAIVAGFVHGPFVLVFGLVGAVPGAICSWLSGKR